MRTTLDLTEVISPDALACQISSKYSEWKSMRAKWEDERVELRNFVYATDTRTTSVGEKTPWGNSTTMPKLTQIHDNLIANYEAAIFPQQKFFKWQSDDIQSDEKARIISDYMWTKIVQSDFMSTAELLIQDYVRDGNCFATIDYINDYLTTEDGEFIVKYVGPKLVRISPYDIVFNLTASDFASSPKIIRKLYTLGDIAKMNEDGVPGLGDLLSKMYYARSTVGDQRYVKQAAGFVADGFGSIQQYYQSGYVEVLEFYGDLYDKDTQTLKRNRKIVIADRAYIVSDEPLQSWLGTDGIFHAGWRPRPDNLMAMGPLDNLVGMQYRLDHLENMKADVMDQIAVPSKKIAGEVEIRGDGGPGTEYRFTPGEGDVSYLAPDTTALQADFQIDKLEMRMEEMAGAPRNAMGIRTPGEKTAFEVDTLMTSAGRIFQHKAQRFEMEFLEPILNNMLEVSLRYMNGAESFRTTGSAGEDTIDQVTKEDLRARGKLYPMGARHFAEKARRVQNIQQLVNIKATDPQGIGMHLDSRAIAKVLADELGEEDFYKEFAAIQEQMEAQLATNDAEVSMSDQMDQRMNAGV